MSPNYKKKDWLLLSSRTTSSLNSQRYLCSPPPRASLSNEKPSFCFSSTSLSTVGSGRNARASKPCWDTRPGAKRKKNTCYISSLIIWTIWPMLVSSIFLFGTRWSTQFRKSKRGEKHWSYLLSKGTTTSALRRWLKIIQIFSKDSLKTSESVVLRRISKKYYPQSQKHKLVSTVLKVSFLSWLFWWMWSLWNANAATFQEKLKV